MAIGSHSSWQHPLRFAAGGDEGNRTLDPLLAGQVLSQLSYTPMNPESHLQRPKKSVFCVFVNTLRLKSFGFLPFFHWIFSIAVFALYRTKYAYARETNDSPSNPPSVLVFGLRVILHSF